MHANGLCSAFVGGNHCLPTAIGCISMITMYPDQRLQGVQVGIAHDDYICLTLPFVCSAHDMHICHIGRPDGLVYPTLRMCTVCMRNYNRVVGTRAHFRA